MTWHAKAARRARTTPGPGRCFDLIERPDADTAVFKVASGKGVYMRSLARDLAMACGTLGHIAALRRLRVGPFTEAQAIPLDDDVLYRTCLTGPVASGRHGACRRPALLLTDAEASGLRHGQAISLVTLMGRIPGAADPCGGLVRAMAGPRHRTGPTGRRLDETRADAVTAYCRIGLRDVIVRLPTNRAGAVADFSAAASE